MNMNVKNNGDDYSASGMTVRSQFAAMALQGLLSGRPNGTSEGDYTWLVRGAVELADMLYDVLNEKEVKEPMKNHLNYSLLGEMVTAEFGTPCEITVSPDSPRSRLTCILKGPTDVTVGMDICEANLLIAAEYLDPIKELYSGLRHEILKATFGQCAAEIREMIDPNSNLD